MQEMQEVRVRSLGWEDPLEEGMKTHSSILAWRIPWTEESGGLQSMGSQRVGHDWSNEAPKHLRQKLEGGKEGCAPKAFRGTGPPDNLVLDF